MGQDLALLRDASGFYDLGISGSDFTDVDGLQTAVDVSLLTDARADASDVPDPFNRRGYIGDILTSSEGRSLGATLWIYSQSRLTTEDLNSIRIDAQNALLWIIQDGVARSVSVSVERTGIREVKANIDIVTNEGKEERYTVLWRLTVGN